MNKAETILREMKKTDDAAGGNSPVHRFSALSKFAVTLVYLVTVMSFGKYDLPGTVWMLVYPAVMFPLSGVSFTAVMYRLRAVFPLVIGTGLLNPLFDRRPFMKVGGLSVTAGWLSCLVIVLKGFLVLSASGLFASVTRIDDLCAALRKLHVPKVMVTVLLLTYRYITSFGEEVGQMSSAYHLRAPRQKGIAVSAWGSFTGQLLLRSIDHEKELYSAMMLRGFRGEFMYADMKKMRLPDYAYLFCWSFVIVFLRLYFGRL